MTSRRRIAAAALGAALLGGTLAAAPAMAQQRSFENPLATTSPSDLDISALSSDASRNTVMVRLTTQNLGDTFTVQAYLAQDRVERDGRYVVLEAEVENGTAKVVGGGSDPDGGDALPGEPLPASAVSFVRRGAELQLSVDTSVLGWTGPYYVGGWLQDEEFSVFAAAELDRAQDGRLVYFGPVSTAPDNTRTSVRLSSPSQTFGRTPARVVAGASPAVPGTMTFYAGRTRVASVAAPRGTASLVLPATLRAGAHALRVTFTPTDTARHAASTGGTSLRVAAQSTTTTVRLSKAKQAFRGKKPARATITVSGRATGTVTVYDGRKRLKTLRLSGGRATYTLPRTLRTGKHSIKAVYRPAVTGTYASSTSRTVRLTVTR